MNPVIKSAKNLGRRAAIRFMKPADSIGYGLDTGIKALTCMPFLLHALVASRKQSKQDRAKRIFGNPIRIPVASAYVGEAKPIIERFSQLVGIPLHELEPAYYVQTAFGARTGFAGAHYIDDMHAVIMGPSEEYDYREHEAMHGVQRVAFARNFKGSDIIRVCEPMACFRKPSSNLPNPVGFLRTRAFRRLIQQKRTDELIALLMLPYAEPLFTKSHLKELERRGFLTGGKFTEKGERCVARKKPAILKFLEGAKKERKENGLE